MSLALLGAGPSTGSTPSGDLVAVLGDYATGGKVQLLYDATHAEKFTLVTEGSEALQRVSSWQNTAANSGLNANNSTVLERPWFAPTGFSGGYPGVLYDKDDAGIKSLWNTTAPPIIRGNDPAEIFALFWHDIDASSPYAAETHPIFFVGGSTSTARLQLQRSIVGGVQQITLSCAVGPSGSAGDASISAPVVGTSASDLQGVIIAHGIKAADGITLSVYHANHPGGLTSTTSSGAKVPFVGTLSLRTRIGGPYSASLANTFDGVIQKIAVTAPLTNAERAAALASIKADVGISW